jgi:DNA-binding LacI/PurR family transcriptional regulator
VQVDRKLRAGEADFVGIDNAGSAEQAVRRLFENGYGAIGFVGYRPEVYTMAERHRGYSRAVADWGKEETSLLIADYKDAELTAPIQDWLRLHPELDALLCGNDDICYAALNAIPQVGKSIPSTMGIISFDEIRWFSMMSCPITAIEQPTGKIGTAAVDLLVDRIEGKRDGAPGELLFDTEMIVRKSCMRGGGSRDERC